MSPYYRASTPSLRALVGHFGASRLRISGHLPRDGRCQVRGLPPDALQSAEDTDDPKNDIVPDDDEDDPLQTVRRCPEDTADEMTLK